MTNSKKEFLRDMLKAVNGYDNAAKKWINEDALLRDGCVNTEYMRKLFKDNDMVKLKMVFAALWVKSLETVFCFTERTGGIIPVGFTKRLEDIVPLSLLKDSSGVCNEVTNIIAGNLVGFCLLPSIKEVNYATKELKLNKLLHNMGETPDQQITISIFMECVSAFNIDIYDLHKLIMCKHYVFKFIEEHNLDENDLTLLGVEVDIDHMVMNVVTILDPIETLHDYSARLDLIKHIVDGVCSQLAPEHHWLTTSEHVLNDAQDSHKHKEQEYRPPAEDISIKAMVRMTANDSRLYNAGEWLPSDIQVIGAAGSHYLLSLWENNAIFKLKLVFTGMLFGIMQSVLKEMNGYPRTKEEVIMQTSERINGMIDISRKNTRPSLPRRQHVVKFIAIWSSDASDTSKLHDLMGCLNVFCITFKDIYTIFKIKRQLHRFLEDNKLGKDVYALTNKELTEEALIERIYKDMENREVLLSTIVNAVCEHIFKGKQKLGGSVVNSGKVQRVSKDDLKIGEMVSMQRESSSVLSEDDIEYWSSDNLRDSEGGLNQSEWLKLLKLDSSDSLKMELVGLLYFLLHVDIDALNSEDASSSGYVVTGNNIGIKVDSPAIETYLVMLLNQKDKLNARKALSKFVRKTNAAKNIDTVMEQLLKVIAAVFWDDITELYSLYKCKCYLDLFKDDLKSRHIAQYALDAFTDNELVLKIMRENKGNDAYFKNIYDKITPSTASSMYVGEDSEAMTEHMNKKMMEDIALQMDKALYPPASPLCATDEDILNSVLGIQQVTESAAELGTKLFDAYLEDRAKKGMDKAPLTNDKLPTDQETSSRDMLLDSVRGGNVELDIASMVDTQLGGQAIYKMTSLEDWLPRWYISDTGSLVLDPLIQMVENTGIYTLSGDTCLKRKLIDVWGIVIRASSITALPLTKSTLIKYVNRCLLTLQRRPFKPSSLHVIVQLVEKAKSLTHYSELMTMIEALVYATVTVFRDNPNELYNLHAAKCSLIEASTNASIPDEITMRVDGRKEPTGNRGVVEYVIKNVSSTEEEEVAKNGYSWDVDLWLGKSTPDRTYKEEGETEEVDESKQGECTRENIIEHVKVSQRELTVVHDNNVLTRDNVYMLFDGSLAVPMLGVKLGLVIYDVHNSTLLVTKEILPSVYVSVSVIDIKELYVDATGKVIIGDDGRFRPRNNKGGKKDSDSTTVTDKEGTKGVHCEIRKAEDMSTLAQGFIQRELAELETLKEKIDQFNPCVTPDARLRDLMESNGCSSFNDFQEKLKTGVFDDVIKSELNSGSIEDALMGKHADIPMYKGTSINEDTKTAFEKRLEEFYAGGTSIFDLYKALDLIVTPNESMTTTDFQERIKAGIVKATFRKETKEQSNVTAPNFDAIHTHGIGLSRTAHISDFDGDVINTHLVLTQRNPTLRIRCLKCRDSKTKELNNALSDIISSYTKVAMGLLCNQCRHRCVTYRQTPFNEHTHM